MLLTRLAFALALGAMCLQIRAAHPIRNEAGEPLNVIILFADDLGWGDLGAQGHPYAQTPAIDRLAATGIRFTDFYVTAPICSASRMGLMTGRIQNRFGMRMLIHDSLDRSVGYHHLPVAEPTIARTLKQAGYRTATIGKWHISFPNRPGAPKMADYGFDHYLLLNSGGKQTYYGARWNRNGTPVATPDRWSAEVYVDEAIRFIEQDRGRPFFINLWSFCPHQEVMCSPQHAAGYAGRSVEEQNYYGTITQMDEQYGRLLRYLDEHGLADRTIVVFSSDNGPEPHVFPWSGLARGSTGGFRGGKHSLYEGGVRVPGIVRWPGVTRPGTTSAEPCWTPDLHATIVAATGSSIDPAFPLDGVDIRDALRGGEARRERPFYWDFPGPVVRNNGQAVGRPSLALRDGRWKIHCDGRFGEVELYDLDIDRNEQWNLRDAMPEKTAELLAKLKAIHADVHGPYSRNAAFWNPRIQDTSSRSP
jgi:arylsulfatase A